MSKTYGELLGPAMEVQTPEEADEYMEYLIQYHLDEGHKETREDAHELALQNIGYYAGYYGNETMQRVWRLFKTTHPVMPWLKEQADD